MLACFQTRPDNTDIWPRLTWPKDQGHAAPGATDNENQWAHPCLQSRGVIEFFMKSKLVTA